jgi:hypothetical protein
MIIRMIMMRWKSFGGSAAEWRYRVHIALHCREQGRGRGLENIEPPRHRFMARKGSRVPLVGGLAPRGEPCRHGAAR